MQADYEFTTDWFSRFHGVWKQLFEIAPPSRYLEIGSWEGRSACFVIDTCASQRPMEIHCIDTWEGGVEHDPAGMTDVERRFDANLALAASRAAHEVRLVKHKRRSSEALAQLLAEGGPEQFDAVYIDGSHQAPDVLTDAVMGFLLLKTGGVIIFDDYLWAMEDAGKQDFFNMPKPAIDAFTTIFQRKLSLAMAPVYQIYARKTAS